MALAAVLNIALSGPQQSAAIRAITPAAPTTDAPAADVIRTTGPDSGANSVAALNTDSSTGAAEARRAATRTPRSRRPTATPEAQALAEDLIVRNQRIYALDGSLAYEGDIDLAPTLARIEAGKRDRHPNDGSVFGNREGRLPRKPRGYYLEWVVRTPGLREVGPQRVVTGKDGEVFYTPDHYNSFIRIR